MASGGDDRFTSTSIRPPGKKGRQTTRPRRSTVRSRMSQKGQTLPSGGRSTNDRSRTVSGSPSVESRASAERRKRSSGRSPSDGGHWPAWSESSHGGGFPLLSRCIFTPFAVYHGSRRGPDAPGRTAVKSLGEDASMASATQQTLQAFTHWLDEIVARGLIEREFFGSEAPRADVQGRTIHGLTVEQRLAHLRGGLLPMAERSGRVMR